MIDLFSDIPQVIKNNFNLSLKCQFYPKEISPKLPKFLSDLKLSEEQLLTEISRKGLDERLRNASLNNNEYIERLDYEVDIIIKMGFAGYFLIVADFVKWAKSCSDRVSLSGQFAIFSLR